MNFINIKFSGWFQSRFATNPDPSDDPRGTRGFMRALPGEPDFDRIIRFQPKGAHMRSHVTQTIGVRVNAVYDNTGCLSDHPLRGARVNLEDNPVFKGENGIVADDGLEPIVPFRLSILNDDFDISRSYSLNPPKFPFSDLRPVSNTTTPGRVAESTGIYNYQELMNERIQRLENETVTPAIAKRIEILKRLLPPNTGDRFFHQIQTYHIELKGPACFMDQQQILVAQVDKTNAWLVDFWLGGWDIDASCGFVEGYLGIPQIESN